MSKTVESYDCKTIEEVFKKGQKAKQDEIIEALLELKMCGAIDSDSYEKIKARIENESEIPNCESCAESVYIGHGLVTCGLVGKCPYAKNEKEKSNEY